jgi:hypothetical protein
MLSGGGEFAFAFTGSGFNFGLLINDREVMRGFIRVPPRTSTLFFYTHSVSEFQLPSTAVTEVIPVASPPILKAGRNTLSVRRTSTSEGSSGAGIALSDIVLWWHENT